MVHVVLPRTLYEIDRKIPSRHLQFRQTVAITTQKSANCIRKWHVYDRIWRGYELQLNSSLYYDILIIYGLLVGSFLDISITHLCLLSALRPICMYIIFLITIAANADVLINRSWLVLFRLINVLQLYSIFWKNFKKKFGIKKFFKRPIRVKCLKFVRWRFWQKWIFLNVIVLLYEVELRFLHTYRIWYISLTLLIWITT